MDHRAEPTLGEAQAMLEDLASAFLPGLLTGQRDARRRSPAAEAQILNVEARYRTLVEQIPAIVFMIHLDRGIGEAYVSPYIEATLGYTQAEWLEDPVRWYHQIHPDDNVRWSVEAAEMFLTGNPLKSVYRVIARDGHVVWFHCEAQVVRGEDGQPYLIQGVAFDISGLKRAEEALEQERNFGATILDTVSTLIIVVDPEGKVVHFNRACEQTTSYQFAEVKGRYAWELFEIAEDCDRFKSAFEQLLAARVPANAERHWIAGDSETRLISWSGVVVTDAKGGVSHVIATGVDITESKRLEKAILDISGREQRRIGQDLHDGLGQHLTGIAFMSKSLEQKLAERSLGEAADAAKIVNLVNEAINKTRELARGLLPVVSDALGLMSALERWSTEVQDLFGVTCTFQCDSPVLIYDDNAALHLYHIAQEAVNNAIKHGSPTNIFINLSSCGDGVALCIRDDGVGLPEESMGSPGMGLRIMNYRAKMIGGTLEIGRAPDGGAMVTCFFQPGSSYPGAIP